MSKEKTTLMTTEIVIFTKHLEEFERAADEVSGVVKILETKPLDYTPSNFSKIQVEFENPATLFQLGCFFQIFLKKL